MTNASIHITQHDLEALLGNASACAAVMMRGQALHARAGDLTAADFEKVQSALQAYWLDADGPDLTRFAGLSVGGEFYFLFAYFLPGHHDLLGFLFPIDVPLVRIRKEMTDMMRVLLDPKRIPVSPPPEAPGENPASKEKAGPKKSGPSRKPSRESEEEDPLEQTLQFLFKSFPEPDPEEPETAQDQGWQREIDSVPPEEGQPVSEIPSHPEQEKETTALPAERDLSGTKPPPPNPPEEETFQELSLETDLLSPPPSKAKKEPPRTASAHLEDVDDVPLTPQPLGDDFFSSDETGPIRVSLPDEDENDWQPLNDLPVRDEDLASILQDDFDLDDDLTDLSSLDDDVFEPEPSEEDTGEVHVHREKSDTLLAEILAGEMEDAQAMDEVSDVTFYLVPRLAHHYLLGELSHRLRRWVPKICQAFAWRLDFLSVRPDYLKWTLSDFPEAAIKEMLQIMRRQTSDRIFRDFPSLQVENQTGDYWSPSYLVDKENRYFSTQALMSFVSKTRFEDDEG
jgi:REP element-mobilizing transposase RayT